jgi:hypothetical protein
MLLSNAIDFAMSSTREEKNTTAGGDALARDPSGFATGGAIGSDVSNPTQP